MWFRLMLAMGVVVTVGCGHASSQSAETPHPAKAVYADAADGPGVAPGEQALENFEPFRAEYERVYRDKSGETRKDRVVITAERVAWDAIPAILVTLIDTGSADYDDTTARIQARVFAESDQRLLFQITPVPGQAKDYLLIHLDDSVRATQVEAASGKASTQTMPAPMPQLGAPAAWIVGSMELSEGQTIRFDNADAPASSSILGARPFHVDGRETFEGHDAWVVSYPLGMTSPRVIQNFIVDRPPYLLGKRPMDLETRETSEVGTLRLLALSTFGN